MRKPNSLANIFFLFCLFCCSCLKAQTNRTDSSSQQYAFNNAVNKFYASQGNQSPLFNGPEYYLYDPHIKGNAYFMENSAFAAGAVLYDGIWYNNVQMIYDIYKDQVVILLYNHFSKIYLINEKVEGFDYLDHHFKNIMSDTIANKAELKSGIYDELYNGKTEVLVKRYKNIQTTNGGFSGPESFFDSHRSLFIKKGRNYFEISGKGSLLDVLKDKKKELDSYIKSANIKFRKDPENAMVKIANYYDQLTK